MSDKTKITIRVGKDYRGSSRYTTTLTVLGLSLVIDASDEPDKLWSRAEKMADIIENYHDVEVDAYTEADDSDSFY